MTLLQFAVFTMKTVNTGLQHDRLRFPLRLQRCCRNNIDSPLRALGSRIPVQRAALHRSSVLENHCRLSLLAPLENLVSSSFELALGGA